MGQQNNISNLIVRLPMNADFSVRTMGHVQYNTKWTHFPRTINEYILYFVKSGDMYIEEDGVQYHVKKGEYLLLEPNKHHAGFQASTISYYYIHFSCSEEMTAFPFTEALAEQIHQFRTNLLKAEWDYMWKRSPSDQCDLYFPKHGSFESMYNYLQSLKELDRIFFEGLEGRRKIASLRLEEMLIMLCRDFANQCTSSIRLESQMLIRKIRLYISENYSQPITSDTISSLFNLNYDYINRQFRKYVGQTIHDYLLSLRISHAQELIASGTKICDTASLVGIDDPAYFSRMFKKATGISPSEYSKRFSLTRRKQ